MTKERRRRTIPRAGKEWMIAFTYEQVRDAVHKNLKVPAPRAGGGEPGAWSASGSCPRTILLQGKRGKRGIFGEPQRLRRRPEGSETRGSGAGRRYTRLITP